ncbi:MAG: Hsp70 family protein [Oscillospiraceae bacterium]|nr:Hsp70 family protein [Oscillospiraceae bacterium]
MDKIVGIDLGTSTSEIAFINDKGEVELIPNHLGEFITPSVVHIKENGEIIVGMPAKEQLILDPENTFMEVKRLMGTDTLLKSHDKSYTPVQLSSFILKYLIDCASEYLNEEVKRAVITVPAYFTDVQRRDTLKAGESIGLKVERIVNEPTAASLDYGIMNMDKCQNVLVYDFGGGTLDVTVLELFEGVIDVKSSCGNNSLGGKEFDEAIMNYLVEKINKQHKINVSDDLRSMVRIKQVSEECKIALSSQNDFNIDLPFIYNKKGTPLGFSETITRDFFESLIKDKVYSTLDQIKTALLDANLKSEELDLVILVGGTTKIPLIKDFFKNELNLTPESVVDPDLAVVRGAAIQAGIIDDEFKDQGKDIVIADVCPHSLSHECLRGGSDFWDFDLFCDILIKRNTTIPYETQNIYQTVHDNQREVEVKVYQGESEDPKENTFLNKFLLSGIPPARAGKEKIKVAFSYDLNGILSVSAEIVSTGKSAGIEIDTRSIKSSDQDIDLELWKDKEKAKKYRSVIRKAEKILNEEDFDDIFGLEDDINELKKGIVLDYDVSDLDEIKNDILDTLELLED